MEKISSPKDKSTAPEIKLKEEIAVIVKKEKITSPKFKSASREIPIEIRVIEGVEIRESKSTEERAIIDFVEEEENIVSPKDKSLIPQIPTQTGVIDGVKVKEIKLETELAVKDIHKKDEKIPSPKAKPPASEVSSEIEVRPEFEREELKEEILLTKIVREEEMVPSPKDESPTSEIPKELKVKDEAKLSKKIFYHSEVSTTSDISSRSEIKSAEHFLRSKFKVSEDESADIQTTEARKSTDLTLMSRTTEIESPDDVVIDRDVCTPDAKKLTSLHGSRTKTEVQTKSKYISKKMSSHVSRMDVYEKSIEVQRKSREKHIVSEFDRRSTDDIHKTSHLLKYKTDVDHELTADEKALDIYLDGKTDTTKEFEEIHSKETKLSGIDSAFEKRSVVARLEGAGKILALKKQYDTDEGFVSDALSEHESKMSRIVQLSEKELHDEEYFDLSSTRTSTQTYLQEMSTAIIDKQSMSKVYSVKDVPEPLSKSDFISPTLPDEKVQLETLSSSRASIVDTDSESSNLSSFIGQKSIIMQKELSSISKVFDSTSTVTEVPTAPTESTQKGTEYLEVERMIPKPLISDSKLEATAMTATSQLDYDSTYLSSFHKKVDFTHDSTTIDDYITSDEVSYLSSGLHSDSTKLSETDAELIFSETDSSMRIDTSSLHDTTRARSDSYPSSIPEVPQIETEPIVVMTDDIIEVTLQNGFEAGDSDYRKDTPEILIDERKSKAKEKVKSKTGEITKVPKPKKKITKASPKLRSFKAESDADVSSDDDKFVHKTRLTRTTTTSKKPQTSGIPKLVRPSSTTTESRTTHAYLKSKSRMQKESETTPVRTVRKYDTRVHGYMQSTVSRDMKIDRQVKEKEKTVQRGAKNKKEMDRFNENLKSSLKSRTETRRIESTYAQRHTYQRTTISSERKVVSSKEGTPVKSKTKKPEETPPKSPRKKEPKTAPIDSNKYAEAKSKTIKMSHSESKTRTLQKSEVIFVRDSPKPSASPTKLKRAVIIDQAKKERDKIPDVIEPEKVVQFSDRIRSQSVIPSSCQEMIAKESKSVSPTSLPGSPVRVRSANGTKVMTSEVFTRTQNYTGSIEVIYRQPYENLRKLASALKNETEVSLIDTTDSSLSESVALPSSPSDHDVSSDANGRFRSVSPTSPRKRKSLESIHESDHRISDIIPCAEIVEEDICAIPRQLVMSQYQEMGPSAEERLSPILDVRVVSPSRIKYQFDYEERDDEDDTRSGTATFVLPDTKAMSSHSMAFRIETRKEV